MSMFKTGLLVFSAALCLSSAAYPAEPSTGIVSAADLGAMCDGGESKLCSAYIAGYAQGYYYASAGARAGYIPCMPHGVDDAQSRAVVTKFMREHPEMKQQGAASVVAAALIVAYPCSR